MRGFTLVELILVMLLLGVISVVIVPRFFMVGDYQVRGYYDDVVSACRYAQKLAVVSGCDVQISTSASGYILSKRQVCDTSSGFTRIQRLPGKDVDTVPPPAGVSLSSAVILYSPLGSAMNSSRVVTDFTLSVGSRSFNVVGETGFVDTP